MALYHEAASVIAHVSSTGQANLEQLVFDRSRPWKSDARQRYALVAKTLQWRTVLRELITASDLLRHERHLTPALALVLVHDHLLRRPDRPGSSGGGDGGRAGGGNGIRLGADHRLAVAVGRHRTRLAAEWKRAMVRRGCSSVSQLRAVIEAPASAGLGLLEENRIDKARRPRWVRLNTLVDVWQPSDVPELTSYTPVSTLAELLPVPAPLDRKSDPAGSSAAPDRQRLLYYVDPTVPHLLALPPTANLTRWPSYRAGRLIIQDKASCFPALLLCHDLLPPEEQDDGDVIDACAAPGNKTTHLAALLHQQQMSTETGRTKPMGSGGEPDTRHTRTIHAFERDPARAKVLQTMVSRAHADRHVQVRQGDFLQVDPSDPRYASVVAILLDPSCSGSGMLDRPDGDGSGGQGPVVEPGFLPTAPVDQPSKAKRRRPAPDREESPITSDPSGPPRPAPSSSRSAAATAAAEEEEEEALRSRLMRLSNLQTHLLKHAMRFPAARRLVYSTCSVHAQENEAVVRRALGSEVARARGWRVMVGGEKMDGMEGRKRSRMGREGSGTEGNEVGAAEEEEAVVDGRAGTMTEQPEGLDGWKTRGCEGVFEGVDAEQTRLACIRCEKGGPEGTGGFFVCGFTRSEQETDTGDQGEISGDDEEWNGFGD